MQALEDADFQISVGDVGQAWQNGYAERLMRTIKEEEVDLSKYGDYTDAYRQIGRFLEEVYMHKRIHSSLGYLPPQSSRVGSSHNRLHRGIFTKNREFRV